MEPTTDKASSSTKIDIKITSPEPFSDLNNDTNLSIKGMKPEFYNAAMDGNIDAFEKLGEQINSILTPNENTILHIHFTNDTDRVSETFVEEVLGMCPTLVQKTNVKNETILHIAARYGHSKILKILIDRAKVLSIDSNEVGAEKSLVRAINDKKDTALHEAARYGHNEVVDFLIKEEPDHSYFGKNVHDETPLYIAVVRQYWKVVDTLLDNSNSPQYNGPSGRTALHAAVVHDNTNSPQCPSYVTKLRGWLVRYNYIPALDARVFSSGKEEVSKLLDKNLLAAKQADENGWVPLHLAALVGNTDAVELLVRKDRTTAYMRDNKGRTALHLAALHKGFSVMEKIIEYCPDCCELVDEKGYNALHYTTMGENRQRFRPGKRLREKLRNLYNEKDEDGNTPLHLLARHTPKDRYCFHFLLRSQSPRVDTMACNKYGQTVLDVAVADVPPFSTQKSSLLPRLKGIGARLGGGVLDNHLREKKKEKRHDSAVDQKEDYLDKSASTISLVATLIATVTFTAAFTLPGGLNPDKGFPILKNNALFNLFVVTNSFSFVLSAAAVFCIFVTSISFVRKHENKYKSLLDSSSVMTLSALFSMVIAFVAGLGAVLDLEKPFVLLRTGLGVGIQVVGGGAVIWGILVAVTHFCYFTYIDKDRRLGETVCGYSLLRDVQLSNTV